MPPAASETLTLALADACHDPIAATQPCGEDDGVVRTIVTEQAFAVVMVGQTSATITALRVTHLG